MGRRIVRWFGIGCLMLASGIGGYVGWLLWGTGLETARAQDRLEATFERQLRSGAGGGDHAREDPLPGTVYGQLLIPAIGVNDFVVQGTSVEDLKEGPGHYPTTADPWDDAGRVGIAGHRTTYLHPFLNLDDLVPGDEIELRTRRGDFEYTITRVYEIPSAGSGIVLGQTPQPTLVLTTCNPKYSSSERLIVTADRL